MPLKAWAIFNAVQIVTETGGEQREETQEVGGMEMTAVGPRAVNEVTDGTTVLVFAYRMLGGNQPLEQVLVVKMAAGVQRVTEDGTHRRPVSREPRVPKVMGRLV